MLCEIVLGHNIMMIFVSIMFAEHEFCDQFIELTFYVLNCMENNVPVDVIYPDISKTFDKVRLMLKKLEVFFPVLHRQRDAA
jgi:hypothetical protein